MHDTAYKIGGLVMDTYLPLTPAKILEIGSQNVNGSLRDHAPRNAEYTGIDLEQGKGVDLVVTSLADWNVPDASFDLVLASSAFEHDKVFWRTFLTMCAKAKPGGYIYINAPSNGAVHRYPHDYWRFYPDAGLALEEWARGEGFEVSLVESFIAERSADIWNDFCAVFRRGPSEAEFNRDFVFQKVTCTNVLTWRSSLIINPMEESEDARLLGQARAEIERWVRDSNSQNVAHAEELELRSRQIDKLAQEIEQQAQRLVTMCEAASDKDEELAELRSRAEQMADEFDRLYLKMEEQAKQHKQQVQQLSAACSDAQSRLAQREEEAVQAWASVDERARERDRLSAEVEKVRAHLVSANNWVERLALTRTEMERRIARLENSLAVQMKGSERLQQQNNAFVERNRVLTERLQALAGHTKLPSSTSKNDIARLTRAYASSDRPLAEQVNELMSQHLKDEERLRERFREIARLTLLLQERDRTVAEHQKQVEWLRRVIMILTMGYSKSVKAQLAGLLPTFFTNMRRRALLKRKGLFDADAYTALNPDVIRAGVDPMRHYVNHGMQEDRIWRREA